MRSDIDTLRAELAELRATLDNEQCRGEPPAPWWTSSLTCWFWTPPDWTQLAACVHRPYGKKWVLNVENRECELVFGGEYETAREAMRAAAEHLKNTTEPS